MQAHPILDTPRGRSAFRYPDPEGAPDADGRRYHAALDWFAPGGHPVRSAVAGVVVEAKPSRGITGQVFGGTCKVRAPGGLVYVMRHVAPHVVVGQPVAAGERVAIVSPWADGPPHVHLEIWRELAGGYRLANMIDPDTITWTTAAAPPPWPPPFGGSLRLGGLPGHPVRRGWDECIGRMRNIARNGLEAPTAFITWRGHRWDGARQVAGVTRHLLAKYGL